MREYKPRIYTERTNLWTGLIALVVAGIGIGLLYISANWQWLINRPGIQTVTRDLGGFLVVSVAIAILWELVAKRAFVAELMAKAKLAEDVRSAGIAEIPHNFYRDIEWPDLLRRVNKLDIFFAYGRTWRGSHSAELRNLATRNDSRVRVVLPDPEDDMLMQELARRFDMDQEDVTALIVDAKDDFIDIFSAPRAAADFSLWYLTTSPVFSFYRFDHMAILALYKHSHGRGHVPVFVVERGGTIYDFIREEFDAFTQDDGLARRIYPREE